jgi:hypothetical protein
MPAAPRPVAVGPEVAPLKPETAFVEDVTPNMGDEEKGRTIGGEVMRKFHSYDPEHTARIEKKLVRRIDKRIMPLVVVIYIFSYLDRNSVRPTALAQVIVAYVQTDHTSEAVWTR